MAKLPHSQFANDLRWDARDLDHKLTGPCVHRPHGKTGHRTDSGMGKAVTRLGLG